MTALPTPSPAQPGTFGLAKTGRLATALGTEFRPFLVLDHGQVLEDHRHGAVLRPLADYLQRREADPESVVFCDAPIRRRLVDYGGGDPDGYLETTLRRMVAAAGRTLEGTPHSLLDHAALALLHILGDRSPTWLTDYIAAPGHALGAQLVDRAYELVGIELFAGRAHGDVRPVDLDEYRLAWLEELAEGVRA